MRKGFTQDIEQQQQSNKKKTFYYDDYSTHLMFTPMGLIFLRYCISRDRNGTDFVLALFQN